MAIDVFLIVFYKYNSEALRKLEKMYIVIITSLVFIPAITFLFIHTKERGPMYASVTVSASLDFVATVTHEIQQIWCSISPRWVMFRIIFFYGPIWYAPLPKHLLPAILIGF
jgi:hypothetical protein